MKDNQQALEAIEYFQAGQQEKAKEMALTLLKKNPADSIALTLMGDYARVKGQLDEAIDYYRRSLHVNPTDQGVMKALGNTQSLAGKHRDALDTYRTLLQIDPKDSEILLGIAQSQQALGDLSTAERAIRMALQLNPRDAQAYYLLGILSKARGDDMETTVSYLRSAVELAPENITIHYELANFFLFAGDLENACNTYLEILQNSGPETSNVFSNWLFYQHNLDQLTPEHLFDCHKRWLQRYKASSRRNKLKDFTNAPNPNRRLRIGFTSPDFYAHSVFFFLNSLFSHYDRNQYTFICFSDRLESQEDVLSRILINHVDEWYRTKGLNYSALDELIQNKQIDILIDLTGHTGENRMINYMKRCAPVQVTWLGYPNTTGLDSMDYRMVDEITDPAPQADQLATETLYRLPAPFLCFGPPEDWKTLEIKKNLTPDKIVFGSFNSALKLSDSTIALWCRILQLAPNSELVIKCRPFGKSMTIARLVNKMKEQGIHENRLRILDYLKPLDDHLMAYNEIDLGLDPFPYNGTTTSVEALWMGVPFITKEGDRHCARVGMTLLKSVGLEELIADSDEAYVRKAVEIAKDRGKLTEIKRTLRQRMLDSPLCDSEGFTRKFETALREMWQQWCEEKIAAS